MGERGESVIERKSEEREKEKWGKGEKENW